MERIERDFRDLCIEIARGEVGGDRFNTLLLQTGICLDDREWDMANKLLGHSEHIKILSLERTAAH